MLKISENTENTPVKGENIVVVVVDIWNNERCERVCIIKAETVFK